MFLARKKPVGISVTKILGDTSCQANHYETCCQQIIDSFSFLVLPQHDRQCRAVIMWWNVEYMSCSETHSILFNWENLRIQPQTIVMKCQIDLCCHHCCVVWLPACWWPQLLFCVAASLLVATVVVLCGCQLAGGHSCWFVWLPACWWPQLLFCVAACLVLVLQINWHMLVLSKVQWRYLLAQEMRSQDSDCSRNFMGQKGRLHVNATMLKPTPTNQPSDKLRVITCNNNTNMFRDLNLNMQNGRPNWACRRHGLPTSANRSCGVSCRANTQSYVTTWPDSLWEWHRGVVRSSHIDAGWRGGWEGFENAENKACGWWPPGQRW